MKTIPFDASRYMDSAEQDDNLLLAALNDIARAHGIDSSGKRNWLVSRGSLSLAGERCKITF